MGFTKKKNKIRKRIIFVFIFIIIFCGAAVGVYIMYNKQVQKIQETYLGQIDDLRMQQYNLKRMVLTPIYDIPAGTKIEAHMVEEKEMLLDVNQEKLLTQDNLGDIAVIDLKSGNPIFKSMIITEDITKDLREQEFNMLLLHSNLKKDKYLDVRIGYANGDDYIVLSKKKVRNIDLTKNIVWLWLDEEEIMTINSAIVDAYLNKGTKLYIVTYVEPNIQKASVPNYPVKINVLNIMKSNPNILKLAKTSLSEQVRLQLDKRLLQLKPEDISNVDAGVSEETSKRSEKINDKNNESKSLDESKAQSKEEDTKETKEGSESGAFFKPK